MENSKLGTFNWKDVLHALLAAVIALVVTVLPMVASVVPAWLQPVWPAVVTFISGLAAALGFNSQNKLLKKD